MNYDCVFRSYNCVFHSKIVLFAQCMIAPRVAMLPYINCAGADGGGGPFWVTPYLN